MAETSLSISLALIACKCGTFRGLFEFTGQTHTMEHGARACERQACQGKFESETGSPCTPENFRGPDSSDFDFLDKEGFLCYNLPAEIAASQLHSRLLTSFSGRSFFISIFFVRKATRNLKAFCLRKFDIL